MQKINIAELIEELGTIALSTEDVNSPGEMNRPGEMICPREYELSRGKLTVLQEIWTVPREINCPWEYELSLGRLTVPVDMNCTRGKNRPRDYEPSRGK